MDDNQGQFESYEGFEEDLNQKKKRRPLFGCAVLVLILFVSFAAVASLWLVDDTYESSYDLVEYAPDLRMDLTRLFKSESDWQDGFERVETLTTDLENMKVSMTKNKDAFNKALRHRRNLFVLIEKLEVYPSLLFDTQLSNNKASDMVTQISTKEAEVYERLSYFDEEVLKISLTDLKQWAELPEFKPYVSDMDYWIEYYDYGFSAEQEALIASSERLGEVPEEVFETYHYLTEIPEGTFDYYDLLDEDQDVRAAAYLTVYEKNNIGAELLASALEGEVLANNYLAKLYGYEDAFEMALESDGIDLPEYEAFTRDLKQGLVLLHRWKGIEKKLIGLESSERLHIYDTALPWINDKYVLDGGISYEEASLLTENALSPLGEVYISVYKDLLERSVIDILPRDDKVDGAYTWGTYDTGPYVLLNYFGNLEDMMTFGHEMGHAVHHELSRKNQSFSDYNASVLIAEMVATTNEALMFDYIFSNPQVFASETREALLIKYAQSIQDTIYMQLLASEFQREIHEDAKNGINLDANHLNDKWSDLVQTYFGPSYEVTETDGLGWTEMQHLYWGFYVHKYAIGYTAGISNAQAISTDRAFVDMYVQMLKDGGSKTPSDQLETFGYGPSGLDAIPDMLDRFEWILDEIEASIE